MNYISGILEYPELDLDESFHRIFDILPDEFRSYWGLDDCHAPEGDDPAEWERRQQLDDLARRITVLADALIRPRIPEAQLEAPAELREAARRGRDTLRDLVEQIRTEEPATYAEIAVALSQLRVREDVEYSFFLACLQFYLSSYLVSPRVLAERVVNLTRFVSRVRGGRAIQYLGRVSRCYLYEMDPELAIMSRAAMEASLEELIPEKQVRTARGIPSNHRIGLKDYIETARGLILTDDDVEVAYKVKQAGDDAIHFSAEAVSDSDSILENLVIILRALEDQPRAKQ